ncbi:hypothetical protein GLAREA_05073 [Glarea lozoyensis ATCC 20868]|uniref:Uncharacterized protein n=1 Tax=Glarea lozoyensis (strain ATCC 20868 / MF5171) TaxID=1116229 RepID=S3DUX2_GLAL2|nr:uncharacterized protein GLAREA_05073 [Glarea lozoyensis ATCC 20868]EPE35736.1 hypothetical protein GLAREA_05073 [Glarea lozoyensis ATCC 20868]
MIRRSISQIFQTNSPNEQTTNQEPEHIQTMISSLGGRRPTLPTPSQTPLNQQPSLPHTTSTPNPNAWIASFTRQQPASQIEAMPPNANTNPNSQPFRVPRVILDPARRHPVFFTERLKRAPHGVGGGVGGVAEGYVWEEGRRDVSVGNGAGSRL